MNKENLFIVSGIIFFFSTSVMNGEPVDTLKRKSPAEAAKYALLFPGGGQFYNENYLKGGILIGLEMYSLIKFNDYRLDVKRDNISSAISKRNKCLWWSFFIYFYLFRASFLACLYMRKQWEKKRTHESLYGMSLLECG